MIKRPFGLGKIIPLLPRLLKVCKSWVQSRPEWDLPSSVKWLLYAGLFLYSWNLDSSGGIWKWWGLYFGISLPTLTSWAFQEGFIAFCLLASFFFFIEPLLPSRWSGWFRTVRKNPGWIVLDGILSLAAFALGMLPIISASREWWGGGLLFLLWVLLSLAMLVKMIIDACKACRQIMGALATPTRC